MRLNEIQERFADLMLRPDVPEPAQDFEVLFCDESVQERLKIYRNNIVGGLTDALIATLPLTEKLVGRKFLAGAARVFLSQNPPASGCINLYGEGFDIFVTGFAPAASLPYLPDMIALELAMNRAMYAPDDTTLKAEDLKAFPVEKLSDMFLKLRESVVLLKSRYPLYELREFCLNPEGVAPDIDGGGGNLLIFRPGLEVRLVKLRDDAYNMLSCLQAQMPLGEALAQTLKDYPHFDFQVFLQSQIEQSVFKNGTV